MTGAAITARGLSKRYGTTQALDDVGFDIAAGEFVAVLGPSGAGKTTLLRCLTGMVAPDAGTIDIGGRPLTSLEGRALREVQSRIGMVYQQFNLVGRLSVLRNVLSGRLYGAPPSRWLRYAFDPESQALAAACLDRVDLLDRAWQRADTLSGGQQQRVALARALTQQPTLLLGDEPVASVDPKLADRILGYLRKVNEEDGVTTIVNLHTVPLALRYADRVLGFDKGRLVVDGPISLLEDPATLETIYRSASDAEELEIALPDAVTLSGGALQRGAA